MFNSYIKLLRVEQYAKNAFVLLPLFFGGKLLDWGSLHISLMMAFSFCAVASSVYIVNDILDQAEDRNHPKKCKRPIASGQVSAVAASYLAVVLAGTGVLTAFFISLPCVSVILAYLLLNTFYVFYAKHKSLLDVACIATGFVLRTLAGTFAISLALSSWLILMVFLLCMFLGLGKRWDDLCLMESEQTTGNIRKSLHGYTKNFVLAAMTFLSAINTVCYIMYTMTPGSLLYTRSEHLFFTALWVILGNLRYLQLAFVYQESTSPTKILLKDKGVKTCVTCWILHVLLLLYV